YGDVDGGHAAADDDDAAADRQRAEVGGLAQIGDVLDGSVDAGGVLALGAQRVDAGEPHAEEHGAVGGGELGEEDVAAERPAVLDRDATDRGDIVDLGLGEIVRRLVGGNAVLVEAAGLGLRLEDDDVVAVDRQAVRGGEAGGTGADDGDLLSGGRGT